MTKNRKLCGYVSSADKQNFVALAKLHGTSESRLLGRLVQTVLKNVQNSSEQAVHAIREEGAQKEGGAASPPSRYPCRAMVVSIRLLPQEVAMLEQEAEARALSRSGFIYGLLKKHFTGQPYLGNAEVDALRQSSARLSRIGSNLNQIARRLNAASELNPTPLPKLYQQLHTALEEYKESIRRLIKENMRSWGVVEGDSEEQFISFRE